MKVKTVLPDKYAEEATEVLIEAFKEKFVSIIGDDEKASEVYRLLIDSANFLYVEENEKLLGILTYSTKDSIGHGITLKKITSIFGSVKGLLTFAKLFIIMHHKEAEDELYIDHLAVAQEARGKGLGTLLMNEVVHIASEKGLKKITLAVVSNNSAKQLYEKLGFETVKTVGAWPINKLWKWSFDKAYFMQLNIDINTV